MIALIDDLFIHFLLFRSHCFKYRLNELQSVIQIKMKFSNTILTLACLVFTSVTAETDVNSLPNNIERNTRERIIGGSVVKPDAYPWFAYLNGGGCGGSLVTPEFILTAAHCYNDNIQEKVTIGKYCRWKYNCKVPFERIGVKRRGVFIHPGYREAPLSMDFMLLQLKRRSTTTPVEMDFGSIVKNYEPGRDDLWTVGTYCMKIGMISMVYS